MSLALASKKSDAAPAKSTASPTLRINEPGDAFEREADQVADEIMSGRRLAWSPATMTIDSGLRRKCACGTCELCEESSSAEPKQEGTVQRKSAGAHHAGLAPPIVHEVLRSAGKPLEASTRAFFESRFGYDFGKVRVHTDRRAAESARSVAAAAYAVGEHLVFAAGHYSPSTEAGRRLLAHELAHTLQQSRGGTSPGPVLARAPGGANDARGFVATAADLDHMEGVMNQLAGKLDPATLRTLRTDKTLDIGLVVDSDGDATLVYTVSGDWINPALDKATKELGLARWNPGPGRQARGAVGAPGDAEQRMLLAADNNDFVVKAMVVSRKVCVDCVPALEHYEHGKVLVRVAKVSDTPPAGGTAPPEANPVLPGAAPAPEAPPPDTAAAPEGSLTPAPEVGPAASPAPVEGVVPKAAAESAGDAAVEGAVAEAAVGRGAVAGAIGAAVIKAAAEQAILIAVTLTLQWALAQLFEAQLEADIATILKPAILERLNKLEAALAKLQGTRKLYVRITYDFRYLRDSPDNDPVREFMQPAPPMYEPGSVRLVNIHPGNEELDFASGSSEIRETIFPGRERVTARSSYSVLLDDAPRRKREKESAALREKLRKSAPKAAPAQPPPSQPAQTPFLPSPGIAQTPQTFTPLPGAPARPTGPQPEDIVANTKAGVASLLPRGEKLISSSSSPAADIAAFKHDEDNWRSLATINFNYFKDNGPDKARADMDELLNSDQYGGRLRKIRQNLGG